MSQLGQTSDVPITVAGLLDALKTTAANYERADLAEAARWLTGHPSPPAPEVVCHGDLHPFNLLADGEQVTVLDWSAALLAPRAHDIAVTTLLLRRATPACPRHPPLPAHGARSRAPSPAGSSPAFQKHTGVSIGAARAALASGRGEPARAGRGGGLGPPAGGRCERRGHPWLITGPALAARLNSITVASARAR